MEHHMDYHMDCHMDHGSCSEPQAVMSKLENDQSTPAVQQAQQQWHSTADLAALEHLPETMSRSVTKRHEASGTFSEFVVVVTVLLS